MVASRRFRWKRIGLTVVFLMTLFGCENHQEQGGAPGAGPATTTKATGGVTTASPGGPNVRPNEGTGEGVR